MRTFCIAIIGGLFALQAPFASGATITRDFNIEFTSGALNGQTVMGTLSYDDTNLTGTGLEFLSPIGDPFGDPEGFLSIDFMVGPDTFTLANDFSFPDTPELYFQDGDPFGLSIGNLGLPSFSTFFGDDVAPSGFNSLFGEFGVPDAFTHVSDQTGESGAQINLKPLGVPDGGSTLALLGGALLAGGWFIRKPKRS